MGTQSAQGPRGGFYTIIKTLPHLLFSLMSIRRFKAYSPFEIGVRAKFAANEREREREKDIEKKRERGRKKKKTVRVKKLFDS